jgi:Flp pilus assembly pilin Flp
MTHNRRRRLNFHDSQGQTVAEYAMLLAFLVFVVMAVIPTFAATVLKLFTDFSSSFGG